MFLLCYRLAYGLICRVFIYVSLCPSFPHTNVRVIIMHKWCYAHNRLFWHSPSRWSYFWVFVGVNVYQFSILLLFNSMFHWCCVVYLDCVFHYFVFWFYAKCLTCKERTFYIQEALIDTLFKPEGVFCVFDLFRTTSGWLVPEELYSRYCSYIIGFHREIFLTQEKPHKQETTRRYNAHMN